MSRELIYTSAPKGVKPGSQGFCTVAYTQGMPANLIQQLESLSGYRHLFSPQDPKASLNPVAFSHLTTTIAGRRCHLLSRVCDAGLDYTQRTNKFAHHVVLDAAELPAAGPAWLLSQSSFMRSTWLGEPSTLPAGPRVPLGDCTPRVCRAWQQMTGDAGWGGVLAATATGSMVRQVVLVFQPGMDVLALLAESFALLPAELRWHVSFSTYFTKLPAGVECHWRCVVAGTPEAAAAQRTGHNSLVIDLCHPLGRAPAGLYVEAARTGRPPATAPRVEHLADSDLQYALQDLGQPLSQAGLDMPVPPGARARPSDATPPPVSSRPLSHPARKPPPRWPWVLAFAALVFAIVGGGVLVWTVRFGVDRGTAEPVNKHAKTVEIAVAKVPAEIKPAEQTGKAGSPNVTTANADRKEPAKADEAPKESKVVTAPTVPSPGDVKPDTQNVEASGTTESRNADGKGSNSEQKNARPDPFRELRDRVCNVPEYKHVSAAGRNPSVEAWHQLVQLPASLTRCEISLATSAKMFPDNWALRSLRISYSKGNSVTKPCVLGKTSGIQTGTVPIAALRADSKGFLSIKWEEGNEDAALTNAMRNCPLRITVPGCDDAVVYLRKPTDPSPIALADLTRQDRLVTELSVADIPTDIPVRIDVLDPLPAGITKPAPKDEGQQVWEFRAEDDKRICFCLQVEHKGPEQIVITLTDKGMTLDGELLYAHNVAARIDEKVKEKESKASEKSKRTESLKDEEDEKKKKELSNDIAKIGEQIVDLEEHIRKAEAIKAVYQKLMKDGKLHYRVYLPIDKYKVDLIRTSEPAPNAAVSQTP